MRLSPVGGEGRERDLLPVEEWLVGSLELIGWDANSLLVTLFVSLFVTEKHFYPLKLCYVIF